MNEEEFCLETRDFYRPPLKQIGMSIFDTKKFFTKSNKINIVPTYLTSSQNDIKDAICKLIKDGGILSRQNIINDNVHPSVSGQALVFLSDLLASVLDFPTSQRPRNVICDAFIASPCQPVIVLTFIDGGKETLDTRIYNTAVTKGVTTALQKFTDENVNVVSGVLCSEDLLDTSQTERKLLQIAKRSSWGVPGESFSMNPVKYDRILTAFWAAVSETKSVLTEIHRGDIDYLQFLTTEQCIAFVENINLKEVQVKSLPGCGATTLMVEIARRLSNLGDTLLVCKSQEEADRLRSVFPNIAIKSHLEVSDLTNFTNIIDETGSAHCLTNGGRLWSFVQASADEIKKRKRSHEYETRQVMNTAARPKCLSKLTYIIIQIERNLKAGKNLSDEDKTDIEELRHCLDAYQKEQNNKEKLICLLSSNTKKTKLEYLSREAETMNLLDKYKQTVYLQNTSESLPIPDKKYLSAQAFNEGTEGRLCHLFRHIKDIMLERGDLFPILGDVIKQGRNRIFYLKAKTEFLKQAIAEGSVQGDNIIQGGHRFGEGETRMKGQKEVNEMVEAFQNGTGKTLGVLEVLHTPKLTDSVSPTFTDLMKIEELRKDLKTTEMITLQQEIQMNDLTDGNDCSVMWEFSMQQVSKDLASNSMKDFITDNTGYEDIELPVEEPAEANKCSESFKDESRCGIEHGVVHHLALFQHGTVGKSNILVILRNALREDLNELLNLQTQSDNLERVYGCPVHVVGEVETTNSKPVSCPPMTLDKERVWQDLDVTSDNLKLINSSMSGSDHHNNQFRQYRGTCTTEPIPLFCSFAAFNVSKYWESHSRLKIKSRVTGWSLLEVGVCEEGDVDTWYWVSDKPRPYWAVRLADCRTHYPGICTRVIGDGKHVGGCRTNTLSNTPGTDALISIGTVVDVSAGRLAFIDLKNNQVLHKFDVKFTQPLYPRFSITVWSHECDGRMELVTGMDITMTNCKRKVIHEALVDQ